jgi:hypothetical protein
MRARLPLSRFFQYLLVVPAALLIGCAQLSPAVYRPTPDSIAPFKQYAGARIKVAEIAGPARFDAQCRGVGPIQVADNLSIGEFIARGFNEELKFAGLLAEDGVRLRGTVTRAAFSTSSALVNGYWELGLALQSSNGRDMSVEYRHDFEAGFEGLGACHRASQALGDAAQQLVRRVVTDPRFATLIR